MRNRFMLSWSLVWALSIAGNVARCQESDNAAGPVVFTVQDDHRNMMEQLGITRLCPGPSGNPGPAEWKQALYCIVQQLTFGRSSTAAATPGQ